MYEFHYVDLFATKGIEYIVVIIYLIILIPFWKFLVKSNSDHDSKGGVSIRLLLILLLLAFGCYGIVKAGEKKPPEEITIKRLQNLYGPVDFPHADHFDYVDDCSTCHHHSGGKTIACINCHKPIKFYKYQGSKRKNGIGLKAAYHMRCLGCHKEEESGPTGCTECHERVRNPIPNFPQAKAHKE